MGKTIRRNKTKEYGKAKKNAVKFRENRRGKKDVRSFFNREY